MSLVSPIARHSSTTVRMPAAAAVVSNETIHTGDGRSWPARPGTGELIVPVLDGTLERFREHSTIVIDGVHVEQHAAQLGAVRAAGWECSAVGAWTTYHRDGRTVSVGLREDMSHDRNHFGTLVDPGTDPGVLAMLLDRYITLTGYPWRGTCATSALNGIRLTWENALGQPRWTLPKTGPGFPVGALTWSRPATADEVSWGYFHTFDVNASYLAAAINAHVAWSGLEHTGPRMFDPQLPGYWLLDLDTPTLEWDADPGRPPLVGRQLRHGQAWVTTPIGKLLQDLGHRVEVRDSWTAQLRIGNGSPAARVFTRWAEQLRDARLAAETDGLLVIVEAIKRTYTDAIGGMQKDGMRIHRPDWAHTVIDLARANLFRRMLRVRQSEGIWPVSIVTDSLTYADCSASGYVLGQALGVNRCAVSCGCDDPGRRLLGSFKHAECLTAEQWSTRASRPASATPAARAGRRSRTDRRGTRRV